jgi:2-phosphosulfolactate phosphatase
MHEQVIQVHFLPSKVPESELAGSAVVVIDVLRASTTICCALAAGASHVVPFRTIEETLAAAEKAGRSNVVLGGERGGKRIEGFDLGNSPAEYTANIIRGRSVHITTTNGTQALYHARQAKRVIVGAIVNRSAVVASLKNEPRIDILCAGTNGEITGEDIMAAGAIVALLRERSKGRGMISKDADTAMGVWRSLENAAPLAGINLCEMLVRSLRFSEGGRNLIEIGLDHDLADCAQVDQLSIVPELNVQEWKIRPV